MLWCISPQARYIASRTRLKLSTQSSMAPHHGVKLREHTHLAEPLPLFSCTPTRQQTTHTHTSDRLGKNLVDELDVLCRWRKDGCKWGGQLQQWQSHSKTCLFNPSNQPEWLKPDSKSEGAIC